MKNSEPFPTKSDLNEGCSALRTRFSELRQTALISAENYEICEIAPLNADLLRDFNPVNLSDIRIYSKYVAYITDLNLRVRLLTKGIETGKTEKQVCARLAKCILIISLILEYFDSFVQMAAL